MANWPPEYTKVFMDRQIRLRKILTDDDIAKGALEFYRTNPVEFIEHWCVTYDPRNAGSELPTLMPFIMFPKQKELVMFLYSCLQDKESGLIEKSRDMGATWVCCAFSVWIWLFLPGAATGWGSRKETLVDKLGDPDSIFEKIRMVIYNIPKFFWPKDFRFKEHCAYMKITNPDANSKSTITGESGVNIGRGGRSSIYFKDEALPVSSKVLTPSGWKKNGALIKGEFVIGADGKHKEIIHINDCGKVQLYEVIFSDGTSAKCSTNHMWTVQNVLGKHKTLTLRTKEIAENYIYCSPKGQKKYRYQIENCKPVVFKRKEYPLDPYIVGALLGDGSVNSVPEHCPMLTTGNKELVENVRKLLPEGCELREGKNGRLEHRMVDILGRRGYNHKSRARQAVLNADIAGKLAHEKRIPENYLFGAIDDRFSLLAGLMDTDGSASNGGLPSYHTSSPGLAEDFRFLGESLGASVTLDIKKDKRGYRDQYVLFLKFNNDVNPFRISAKKNRLEKRKNTANRSIVDIYSIGQEEARCITIASESGLYLTNNCIVTHNSAHYERPESIEAALGDNTNVQIDISSVNGTAGVFARKREAGVLWTEKSAVPPGNTRVFIMDWRDHPQKTQEWYEQRRAKAKREGLLHLFSQEVDRDYSSSVEGIVIKPDWVNAAIDAHLKIGINCEGTKTAALDVADEGRDSHALSIRKGVVLSYLEEWAQGDGGEATRKTINICNRERVFSLNYDCIGVGATVKAEINRLITEEKIKLKFHIMKWNASAKVLNPNSRVGVHKNGSPDLATPKNKDFYGNLKAQGWWNLGRRFEKTYEGKLIDPPSNLEDFINGKNVFLRIFPFLKQQQKSIAEET